MPLLKREPDRYPESLFMLAGDELPWWVAHVRSRQEKALARYLLRHRIRSYLPQVQGKTHRSGRIFRSFLPLFPGYVFLRGSAGDRRTSLKSYLIVQNLRVRDQAQLGEELRQVHSLQLAGASLVRLHDFVPGNRYA